jgi:hypothetical protein
MTKSNVHELSQRTGELMMRAGADEAPLPRGLNLRFQL